MAEGRENIGKRALQGERPRPEDGALLKFGGVGQGQQQQGGQDTAQQGQEGFFEEAAQQGSGQGHQGATALGGQDTT